MNKHTIIYIYMSFLHINLFSEQKVNSSLMIRKRKVSNCTNKHQTDRTKTYRIERKTKKRTFYITAWLQVIDTALSTFSNMFFFHNCLSFHLITSLLYVTSHVLFNWLYLFPTLSHSCVISNLPARLTLWNRCLFAFHVVWAFSIFLSILIRFPLFKCPT